MRFSAAKVRAFSIEREAIAITSVCSHCKNAGITRRRTRLATLRIPHFTFRDIRFSKGAAIVQERAFRNPLQTKLFLSRVPPIERARDRFLPLPVICVTLRLFHPRFP